MVLRQSVGPEFQQLAFSTAAIFAEYVPARTDLESGELQLSCSHEAASEHGNRGGGNNLLCAGNGSGGDSRVKRMNCKEYEESSDSFTQSRSNTETPAT